MLPAMLWPRARDGNMTLAAREGAVCAALPVSDCGYVLKTGDIAGYRQRAILAPDPPALERNPGVISGNTGYTEPRRSQLHCCQVRCRCGDSHRG